MQTRDKKAKNKLHIFYVIVRTAETDDTFKISSLFGSKFNKGNKFADDAQVQLKFEQVATWKIINDYRKVNSDALNSFFVGTSVGSHQNENKQLAIKLLEKSYKTSSSEIRKTMQKIGMARI